uniref:uncharacterized protein LOC120334256 isoform X1 n=1 Tax=Styela clava TaxID=7725 RepID=UPI00193993B1|nr:uncharacterized protein LOC120334256 isoform X1 [Styela clava]
MYSVMKAMSYSQYVLYANIILAYLTNCSRGYCSIENLYLNNTKGYISTPPHQNRENENCLWEFSDASTSRGDAIILKIDVMNLVTKHSDEYWWYSVRLSLNGQNICDFQPGVCFIFKPDKVDCGIPQNATSTCTHKIWFTEKDAYPPKVLFESDNDDYKKHHKFKIKYSYVACDNDPVSTNNAAFISSTQKPDQATRGTSQFSHNTAATVTLGRTTKWVNYVASSTTNSDGAIATGVYENSKGLTTESTVVIILGILSGILAIIAVLLAIRLHTTQQKLKKSKTIDLNDISNNDSPVEEINDIPIYSEVNKQKKNKPVVSDEKLVVDNELYNAL